MERWASDDKPLINCWYRVIGGHSLSYWKIKKDYYDPRLGRCYWKIVDYYNGDVIVQGKSLVYCRQMMKENTLKKGYDD